MGNITDLINAKRIALMGADPLNPFNIAQRETKGRAGKAATKRIETFAQDPRGNSDLLKELKKYEEFDPNRQATTRGLEHMRGTNPLVLTLHLRRAWEDYKKQHPDYQRLFEQTETPQ